MSKKGMIAVGLENSKKKIVRKLEHKRGLKLKPEDCDP